MEEKKSFIVYMSWLAPLRSMSDEKIGRLFRYIFEFQNGQEPEIEECDVRIAFEFIKGQLETDNEKYTKRVKANRENGKKHESKKKEEASESQSKPIEANRSQSKPIEANRSQSKPIEAIEENRNPNGRDNDNDNDNDVDLNRFSSSRASAREAKDFVNCLTSDVAWLEAVAMRHKLKSVDDVREKINEYLLSCKIRDVCPSDDKDAKRHFDNWLYIDLQKNRKNGRDEKKSRASKLDELVKLAVGAC